jgi:imidazolonepropionase-like amidohydrolase
MATGFSFRTLLGCAALFGSLTVGMASAQPAAAPWTLLANARVIDGSGTAPIEHAYVLLHGATIASVSSTAPVRLASGSRVIDYSGKTILPGLIADHAHLGIVSGATFGANNYTQAHLLQTLAQYERYGITTLNALGLNGELFYSLQPQMHAGTLPGADLFGADRGIGYERSAPPEALAGGRVDRVGTPAQARAAVDAQAARHPTLIKIWVDDMHGTLPVKMPASISSAIIDEAHRKGLRVAAHVYYLDDAKRLVAEGVDVLAHGVRDRPVDDELIAAMKARGVWYIPTLDLDEASFIYAEHPAWMQEGFFQNALSPELRAQFADPLWRQSVLAKSHEVEVSKAALAMNERNLKTLATAGVRIGFGTDSGAMPVRIPGFAEHRELKLMVDSGLSPIMALHYATQNAAELLGLKDRGLIAPGKLADLLVVDGNPALRIEDADRIAAVWHRGKLVDLQAGTR